VTEERVQILRETIKQHLEAHGPRNWSLVRQRFPDISHATFWRHVKAVREIPPTGGSSRPSAVPDASLASGNGEFGALFEPLKKLADYERLLPEVEEMGRQAKNDRGRIINWRMHAKSLELRRTIILEQVMTAQHLWDLGRMQHLYDEVLEALSAASPELQRDVMTRLSALQERRAKAD
jgi:hypothetical protein